MPESELENVLDDFGNAINQITEEVYRAIDKLDERRLNDPITVLFANDGMRVPEV